MLFREPLAIIFTLSTLELERGRSKHIEIMKYCGRDAAVKLFVLKHMPEIN